MCQKKRLVSGIQPTGKMHLGNYLGAVKNWVALQDQFDAYYMVADLHALTTVYENPQQLRKNKLQLAVDLLAAGIDPKKACLFFQSDVREHAELHVLLSMITPLPWLQRIPSYKDKMTQMTDKDLHTYGFLGYPALQAADILLYNAEWVPVGKDQLPHLELTREIARRFNHFYGNTFLEPQEKLTQFAALPGLDGRKMSKSYANTIPVNSTPEDLRKKVMSMVTDPSRIKRTDVGNPEVCSVFNYHKILNTSTRVSDIENACKKAEIGCVDCKKECSTFLEAYLSGFRKKHDYYSKNIEEVYELLYNGATRARIVAQETMVKVREKVGL